MQLILIKNWDLYFRHEQFSCQKEFWMGELNSFLENSAKREMLVENGEFSLCGNAYCSRGIRVGERIVTSPIRLLRKCARGKKILVKTRAGYMYCIIVDGYNRSSEAVFNTFVNTLPSKS